MTVETEGKVRRDTPTMRLTGEMLRHLTPVRAISVPVLVPTGGYDSLREYLEWARDQLNEDGTKWTWDDIAFDLRVKTGQRIVRESVRQWADRYGLLPAKAEDEETPAEG